MIISEKKQLLLAREEWEEYWEVRIEEWATSLLSGYSSISLCNFNWKKFRGHQVLLNSKVNVREKHPNDSLVSHRLRSSTLLLLRQIIKKEPYQSFYKTNNKNSTHVSLGKMFKGKENLCILEWNISWCIVHTTIALL